VPCTENENLYVAFAGASSVDRGLSSRPTESDGRADAQAARMAVEAATAMQAMGASLGRAEEAGFMILDRFRR